MVSEHHEIEGIAEHLRVVARVDALEDVSPLVLTRALGIHLSAIVPRGCHAALTGNPLTLRFDGRGCDTVVRDRVAHELGHLALDIAGVERPHDEDVASRVGDAIQLPARAVRRVVAIAGWRPWAIAAACPNIMPSRLYPRVATVLGGVCIVRSSGRREAWGPDWLTVGNELPDERAMTREAQGRMGFCVSSAGVFAVPFVDPGGRAGIVLLGPSEAFAMPGALTFVMPSR